MPIISQALPVSGYPGRRARSASSAHERAARRVTLLPSCRLLRLRWALEANRIRRSPVERPVRLFLIVEGQASTQSRFDFGGVPVAVKIDIQVFRRLPQMLYNNVATPAGPAVNVDWDACAPSRRLALELRYCATTSIRRMGVATSVRAIQVRSSESISNNMRAPAFGCFSYSSSMRSISARLSAIARSNAVPYFTLSEFVGPSLDGQNVNLQSGG